MTRRQHVPGPDEQRARYEYVVRVLPATVLERAHLAVFSEMTPEQRVALRDELWSVPAEADATSVSAEPESLAALLRSDAERDALMRTADAAAVAARVVSSAPVVVYFTTGAGSVTIDEHPPWVQELAGHDGAPLDAATYHPRKFSTGVWTGS